MYKTHPFFYCLILGQKSAPYTRDGTVINLQDEYDTASNANYCGPDGKDLGGAANCDDRFDCVNCNCQDRAKATYVPL